ncbi:MAG: SDR family NAD(P)-dependent oxidoreductase [Myxococcales bacterium]
MNWNSRKVLVTGADGFIGSHLVERLAKEGASVRAFCLYNSQASRGWLDQSGPEVLEKLDVRLGDIRDTRFVEECCKDIEVVFHLAALIAIPYSYSAPESFIDTNIRGTMNVLEGVRRCGVRRMVQTSTSEVYGTPKALPIRETHPLSAQSPYAATKVAADQMCLAYHRSFETPVTVLRPFNTYGPRQSTRAVLPTILAQLLSGSREISLGRLDTRRDLTYVADTVAGFLLAGAVEGIEGETFQLGTGHAVSIAELFTAACSALGVQAVVREDKGRLRPDASEVLVLQSDPAQAATRLGWKPEVSLERGLAMTAEWLRHHLADYRQLHHL